MRPATQIPVHLVRALLSQDTKWKLSSSLLQQRWFSDHDEQERNALLRALRTESSREETAANGRKSPRGNKVKHHGSRKKRKNDMQSQTKNGTPHDLAKNKLHSGLNEPASRSKSESTSTKMFDDFFAGLGPSTAELSKEGTKSNIESWGAGVGGKSPNRTRSSNVDMSSFFEEVNAIAARNQSKEEKKSARKLADLDSSRYGANSSSKRHGGDHQDLSSPNMGPLTDILSASQQERNPNAYEEDAFDEYVKVLEEMMESPKFLGQHTQNAVRGEKKQTIIDWLRLDVPSIETNLPTFDGGLKGAHGTPVIESKEFQAELKAQRQRFLDHHEWGDQEYWAAARTLRALGGICAKSANASPLDILWQKIKEAGISLDKSGLCNFLYVSSTFSTRPTRSFASLKGQSVFDFLDGGTSRSEGTDRDLLEKVSKESADDNPDTATEIALFHDILFEPSEQSLSVRIPMLVSQGNAKVAEQLLDDNSDKNLRLRTYAPLYKYHLDKHNVSSAFRLYAKMRGTKSVQLQPETYVQLMACLAENGYFCPDSKPVRGAKKAGYNDASGSLLFDRLASELSDDAVEISSGLAKRLYNAFLLGYKDKNHNTRNLKSLHFLEPLRLCNERAGTKELIVSRVTLNKDTGCCPRSGARLRLINLTSDQKKQLQEQLKNLASSSYEERHSDRTSKAADSIQEFQDALENRKGRPFTAIVDGANVAFYMQNFDEGRFSYHQLKFMVDALESMKENVLVILPQKYFLDSFVLPWLTRSTRQRLTRAEKKIRNELIKSGKVYVVPSGCLDDYYWMLASISRQSQASSGRTDDEFVPPGNPDGRFPGIRPMLISNDLMRDHKLELLEPRLFRRWCSSFIVNFAFSAFVGDECVDKEIGFRTADFYSREIQGNETLDENDVSCGTAWHFPVSDWEETESFCIRIPQ